MFDEDARTTVRMEAILSRDQRTTSHRVLDRQDDRRSTPVNHATRTTTTTASSSSCRRRRRPGVTRVARDAPARVRPDNRTDTTTRGGPLACAVTLAFDDRGIRTRRPCPAIPTTTTWLRLGSLLVILSCVMTVQGAPTMAHENRRLSAPPKWVNPCGLAAEDIDTDTEFVHMLSNKQLLDQVVVQAKTALEHAKLFREEYVRQTFHVDFEDLHSTWKSHHSPWLPGPKDIPKELGKQLDQEFLDKLDVSMLDTALLDAYEYMQKYAVGLEQVVWDQEDHQLSFRKQFKDTEDRLRTVLCELQVALVERMVPLRPDVTRDVMTAEYRTMSGQETYRNIRDWMIFRDYMNGLEYIVQVFEHLGEKIAS